MKLDNIESVYPLSPMQESMLFYAQSRITAKKASLKNTELTHDVLFNQTNIDISGNIQLSEFKQAWQQIVIDNSAFRTGFIWEGLNQAQQFVRKEINLPFDFCDLSGVAAEEKQLALAEKMRVDIEQGFDLTTAPLMRVKLVRLSTNMYRLIWSSHHLIIDRWCIPIVFERLTQYYDALIQHQPLPIKKAPPFKHYIGWRHKLSFDKSERYWQSTLAGFSQSSKLCERQVLAPSSKVEHVINKQLMEQVKQFCRQQKVTVASLFQSAWGLTLNQLLGAQDVVYGLVVSGRPAQIPDVENIIGTFVNNVPVRQTLPEKSNTLQWLKKNQSQGFQRIEFEHEPPIKLHEFTRLASDEALFDHVLVWQNAAPLALSQFIHLSPIPGTLNTAYPLTVSIEEKEHGLQLAAMVQSGWHFIYKDRLFTILESMLAQLITLDAQQTLQDIEGFVLNDAFTEEHFDEILALQPKKKAPGKLLTKFVTGRSLLSRDMIEEFLVTEWQDILELDSISVDDDFFECGGTSLKAVQLVTRLEQAEQKHIPIIQLFAGRTIRSMTQIYLNANWSIKPEWAIPVNTKGEGAPVFYIASPEVNTIGYAQLSRELGSDISGYILQPPPTTEHIRTVRKEEVPAISARFIEEVRHIQPNGPYRLIGMCTGAHIAAEMARQMEEKSLQVSFIGVINTWSLYSISALYHFEKVVDFSRMLGYYRRRISNLKWSEVSNRFLPALKNKVAPSKSAQQPESTNAQNYQLVRQYDDTVVPVEVQKWAKERPADLIKIKHPVTVFRIASKPYWRINSYELGWDYLAEETKVISLKEPVHDAILRQPHIAHFAKQLREELLKK